MRRLTLLLPLLCLAAAAAADAPPAGIPLAEGWLPHGEVEGIHAWGERFVANTYGAVLFIDPAEPEGPRVTGVLPKSAPTYDVDVVGDRLLLIESVPGGFQLAAYDLNDPGSLLPLHAWPIPCRDLEPDGDVLYGWGSGALRAYRMAGPDLVELVAFPIQYDGYSRFDVLDGVVYLYNWSPDPGVRIIDFRDPAAPVLTGRVDDCGWTLLAADGHLYTAEFDGAAQLYVHDLTDPTAPVLVGQLPFYGLGGLYAVDGLAVNPYLERVDPAGPTDLGTLDVDLGEPLTEQAGVCLLYTSQSPRDPE